MSKEVIYEFILAFVEWRSIFGEMVGSGVYILAGGGWWWIYFGWLWMVVGGGWWWVVVDKFWLVMVGGG